jgi:hypothetical protein
MCRRSFKQQSICVRVEPVGSKQLLPSEIMITGGSTPATHKTALRFGLRLGISNFPATRITGSKKIALSGVRRLYVSQRMVDTASCYDRGDWWSSLRSNPSTRNGSLLRQKNKEGWRLPPLYAPMFFKLLFSDPVTVIQPITVRQSRQGWFRWVAFFSFLIQPIDVLSILQIANEDFYNRLRLLGLLALRFHGSHLFHPRLEQSHQLDNTPSLLYLFYSLIQPYSNLFSNALLSRTRSAVFVPSSITR